MKKFTLPKGYHTDLVAMHVCGFTDFTVGDIDRISLNEKRDSRKTFHAVAFQGRAFRCAVSLRGRMPIVNLRLGVHSALNFDASPVSSVVYPETATLLPDPILPAGTPFCSGANSTVEILLGTTVPADFPPGTYRVTAVAEADDYPEARTDFFLEVRAANPPKKNSGNVIFWPHWETFCRQLKLELWSEAFWAEAEKYLRVMAEFGMTSAMVSVCHDPFRYPLPPAFHCYNHYPSMVRWLRSADGKWSFDYSILDRYLELNFWCGIDREIECHSLLPSQIQNPVLGYYSSSGDFVEERTDWNAPEYTSAWETFLTDFRAHAKAGGYLNKLTICPYDEPLDPERFIRVAKMAKRCIPEIRITAAISAERALLVKKHIDIATVHSESGYSRRAVAALRRAGVEVRWYNCCVPEWGNSLFASSFFDVYRQCWITRANGFSGFLRWSIIDWPDDVFGNPGFNWPTGDTHLLYPGTNGPLSSLRFEVWRQGMQDLELLERALDTPEISGKRRAKLERLLKTAGTLAPLKKMYSVAEWRRKLYRTLAE